jgi:predicted RNase H-like HicB family nuclease
VGRMGLRYAVVLRPLSEEEGGGWLAQIPDLPGCVSDGETPEETLRAVEEVQDAWLKVARARRVRVPLPVKEGLCALRLHLRRNARLFARRGPGWTSLPGRRTKRTGSMSGAACRGLTCPQRRGC